MDIILTFYILMWNANKTDSLLVFKKLLKFIIIGLKKKKKKKKNDSVLVLSCIFLVPLPIWGNFFFFP